MRPALIAVVTGLVVGCAPSPPPAGAPSQPKPASSAGRTPHETEVVFVATPQVIVDRMLEAAGVGPGDVVYDLGCGDGRMVITAATRFGAKGVGVEIHPQRVAEARDNARKARVDHLVRIEQGDIFEVDLRPATVVALYLFPELNTKLLPQLKMLRPGSRIVSHDFGIEGYAPERSLRVQGPEYDGSPVTRVHEVLLWTAPLKSAK